MTINDLPDIASRQLAILTDFQFIGIHIVDAIAALQVFAEIGESAREDGNLVAAALQNGHQTVHTLGDGQVLGDVLHHTHVESFQQGHPARKALLEVDLAPHSALRDSPHLGSHPIALSQFVNTLRLDERGVHVETYQAAHTAEHIVFLEGEVDFHLLRELHELRLHLLTICRLASQ